jgi:hypothetical protein
MGKASKENVGKERKERRALKEERECTIKETDT